MLKTNKMFLEIALRGYLFFNYICRNKTDIMEKQEIFEKFNDFLKQGKNVESVYPEILEKHGALDITSGFADKLDGISDPFERLVVGVHAVDQLNTFQLPTSSEVKALADRHEPLLRIALYFNSGRDKMAKQYFEKYLAQF
jgi:hypothetical protein